MEPVAIPIVNPGFEANPIPNGTYNDQVIPMGWSKYDPGNIIGLDYNSLGLLNPTGTVLYGSGAPEGNNVALVFLWREQTNGIAAGYSQQLSSTLSTFTEYTLSVKIGNIAPEVSAPYDLAGFPGYRVELTAGGTVIAMDDDTLSPAEGTFAQSTVSFTTGDSHPQLGQPLGIRLLNLNAPDSGIEVNFDDVHLLAAPAP